MWKVAHSKTTTTDSWAVKKGLSGGFGTSKSVKSCMDRPLGTKSEGLYIVQMSLLADSGCGGSMNNHMKTGQLSVSSVTGIWCRLTDGAVRVLGEATAGFHLLRQLSSCSGRWHKFDLPATKATTDSLV